MSVQIKNLTRSVLPLVKDMRADDGSSVGRIPLDGFIYDLYAAPNSPPPNPTPVTRAAIAKGLRIINKHSAAVLIDLYYTVDVVQAGVVSGTSCRRRLISPPAIRLAAGSTYIDDGEITVEPGGKIQASAKPETGSTLPLTYIDYLISGVERDVT